MLQLPEPWKSFFGELDAELNQKVTLHCLGGFAAKIMYNLPRETSDIDLLPFGTNRDIQEVLSRAEEGSELHIRHHVYLQVVGLGFAQKINAGVATEGHPYKRDRNC